MSEPNAEAVKIIECPRDAWQGLPNVIPAPEKAAHLLTLARAGVRHIDAVSFVSPTHVRQMADSEAVLETFFASLPSGVT
jgi:hydroxymethylglutaryl-CoA lyase